MKFSKKRKSIIGFILFMLPGILGGILVYYINHRFTTAQIQTFIFSFGYSAALIFILLFTVRTFFVFAPYYVMLVIGGNLFGRELGLLYNFIAVFLSASLAYVLSRFIRPTIQRRFRLDRHDAYVEMIDKHGFKILVFMRLAIIFPFDLLNYAAGISGMRYRTFIAANGLGVIPEVVFLTCFGQSLQAPRSVQFAVLLVILCSALIIGAKYRKNIVNGIKSIR